MVGFLLAAAVAVGGALRAWTGFARADAAQSAADEEAVETASKESGADTGTPELGTATDRAPGPPSAPAPGRAHLP